jgi:hypothetical protein
MAAAEEQQQHQQENNDNSSGLPSMFLQLIPQHSYLGYQMLTVPFSSLI